MVKEKPNKIEHESGQEHKKYLQQQRKLDKQVKKTRKANTVAYHKLGILT